VILARASGRRRGLDLHVLDARRLHHADPGRRPVAQFIGNVVYDSVNGAGNLPSRQAFAVVRCSPGHLLVARRLGAFEAL
jgi:hypothetical protein